MKVYSRIEAHNIVQFIHILRASDNVLIDFRWISRPNYNPKMVEKCFLVLVLLWKCTTVRGGSDYVQVGMIDIFTLVLVNDSSYLTSIQ